MAVDFATLSMLAVPTVRLVFEQVVKNRSIRLGELIERVRPKVDRENVEEMLRELKETLNKLKDAELIKEKGSAIEEFNTYYVTANGLEANREVKRVVSRENDI